MLFDQFHLYSYLSKQVFISETRLMKINGYVQLRVKLVHMNSSLRLRGLEKISADKCEVYIVA